MREVIVIEPRRGVSAREIDDFLREQFQQPGQCDGNPLINASIGILRQGDREEQTA